ncbi:MAG: hypothetical protein LUC50_07710 [Ruminococcus sp.]|nr:hypothetical protein [Ruminococcus sp.]
MAHKSHRASILSLILILVAITAGVASIVYALSVHHQHLHDEKWKDYEECGL